MCKRCDDGMDPMEEMWWGCDDDNKHFWHGVIKIVAFIALLTILIASLPNC